MTAERPTAEQVYQAWHGTSDPWGGCADSEAVERVMALFGPSQVVDGGIATPAVPDSGWTDSQWVEWSNDVASEMPEEWDSDEGQEAIILRFVKYATERLAERPSEAAPAADTERRVHMIQRVDDYLDSHRATDSTRLLGEVRDELVRLSGRVASGEIRLAPLLAPDAQTEVFDEVRITYPLGVNGDRHATARVYAHVEDPVRKLQEATEAELSCGIKVTKAEARTVTTTRTPWKSA